MHDKNSLVKQLENFIDSIAEQEIFLRKITFTPNSAIKGSFPESKIERLFQLEKVEIGLGDRFFPSELKFKKENASPIVDIRYSFSLKDKLKLVDREEIIQTAEIGYSIILSIKKESKFLQLSDEEKVKIVEAFGNHSGMLIVLPYVRCITDLLGKASGISLPPLPPIKINKS